MSEAIAADHAEGRANVTWDEATAIESSMRRLATINNALLIADSEADHLRSHLSFQTEARMLARKTSALTARLSSFSREKLVHLRDLVAEDAAKLPSTISKAKSENQYWYLRAAALILPRVDAALLRAV